MQKALETAGVNPDQIGYVETHGTGNRAGRSDRGGNSCIGDGKRPGESKTRWSIGAVKTNIGHAEAASGIAGLMKTVLALEHRKIPPSLHLNRKNPHIDWDRLPVTVPTETSEWKPLNGHRYAGVSSFGFSGTNAHLILEEAPKREVPLNPRERRTHILTISARTQAALDILRREICGCVACLSAGGFGRPVFYG